MPFFLIEFKTKCYTIKKTIPATEQPLVNSQKRRKRQKRNGENGELVVNVVNFTCPFCDKAAVGGLDNCGEKAKKARLAQQTGVIAAARGGAAADEGELLRQ